MASRRINRFLSQAGLGSRRGVERLVREGRVRVNGRRVEDLSLRVDPDADVVEVDGRVVEAPTESVVVLLHKPRGVVSSLRRQGDAPCLADLIPDVPEWGRLFHVGRLDRDSSGLLLLTNDGDLAQALAHPRQPVWKRYLVTMDRRLDVEQRRRFAEGGIELDGRACAPARIEELSEGPPPVYRIELREGRNRQIRRMAEALGRRVVSLHRTAVGPIELGDLEPGSLRRLDEQELRRLREAVSGGLD